MCMTCANEIWYFKIWMFCAVEEDKIISGTEHTITETNKTKFQHTSGCHGLQTGWQPIVSLTVQMFLLSPGLSPLSSSFPWNITFHSKKIMQVIIINFISPQMTKSWSFSLTYIQYIYKLLSRFEYFICFISFIANGKDVLLLGSIVY